MKQINKILNYFIILEILIYFFDIMTLGNTEDTSAVFIYECFAKVALVHILFFKLIYYISIFKKWKEYRKLK